MPIVTYEKQKAKEQRINPTNFAAMDVKSFDTKIGSITNLASTLISMLSEFPKDSEEYTEIRKRIDLLRFFQGNEIDKTKGIVSIPPPSYWNKKQKYIPIPENSTSEEVERITKQNQEIFFNNKICACTKPYFFGYVYDKEMKKYKEYKKDFNRSAEDFFGRSLSEIINDPNCTEKEKELKKNYYKYIPLKRNNSIMNILTYYVEDIEFENKWKKKSGIFDYHILMNNESYIPTSSVIKALREKSKCFYQEYKSITIMESQLESFCGEEYQYENTYKYLYELFSKDIYTVVSNEAELCDCMIYILYNYFKTYNKDVLWNLFGEQIVKNLKSKADKFCYVCESDTGVEYLGKKYRLVETDIDTVAI